MSGSGTGTPVTGAASGGGIVVEPVLEPITLDELKTHLRLDSGTFDGNLTLTQSLAYGSKAVTTAYDHYGAGIDVLGKQADAIVHHGTNGDTGTVDTKIQESDINTETVALDVAPATDWAANDIITGQTSGTTCIVVAKLTALTYTVKDRTGLFTLGEVVGVTGTTAKLADQGATKPTFSGSGYTDWTGGAFAQVSTDGAGSQEPDNADYKKAYTGTKQYIRTASKVLLATCEFGTSVLVNSAVTSEDDDLTDLITDGRMTVENILRRYLLTQTWDYSLQEWPKEDFIKLPGGNLQTVSSFKWKDTDGTETTLTLTTDYLVETNGEGIGKIVLPYGGSWPSETLYPSNPIIIRFVSGWTTADLVPKNIKRAVKFAAEDAYYHGNRHDILNGAIMNLLSSYRLWDEF